MVPTSVDPSARETLDDLRDHDREVLEFLSHDPDSQVAFQGLRRRLGIHPEQLSRALHRLADSELVERTDLGYRVSRRALGFLSPSSLKPAGPNATILQTSREVWRIVAFGPAGFRELGLKKPRARRETRYPRSVRSTSSLSARRWSARESCSGWMPRRRRNPWKAT